MNTAAARTSAPPPVVFRDAFGERRRIVAPSGSDTLDVLCLRGELTAVPSFEFALRERVSRLSGFRHPYFAHVRTVERLSDTARTLALISNAQTGVRISELLVTAAKHEIVLDIDAALCLIRQLVTAMATFHEQAPDAAHGALGPERVIVTPNARLVIVEHVMGSAIEQLQYSEDRYWRELRVPCPRAVGLPVIDHRADVLQTGMLALALLLRRSLNGDEFPSRIGDAVVSARALSADGRLEALPAGLRPWLSSILQLDPRSSFASATEAREELEKVFEMSDDIGAPSALEAFLTRYHERTEMAAEQASQVTAKQPPVVSEQVVPEPVAQQTVDEPPAYVPPVYVPPAYEPPAYEPVAEYHSPSLEPDRVMSPSLERERGMSASFDRDRSPAPSYEPVSGPPVANESAWPEPRHAAAQEPLRYEPVVDNEPVVQEHISLSQFPREQAHESPSLAAKLNRTMEPAHKPLAPSTSSSLSSSSASSLSPSSGHTSFSAHTQAAARPFSHEDIDEEREPTMASRRKGGVNRTAVAAILFLVLAGGATMAARKYFAAAPLTTGTIVVTTEPAGAEVVLDGKSQGASPTTLTVAAGTHVLELRGAGEPRRISLDVAAGAQLSQYIEMGKGAVATGNLQVRSEPAGAKVSVDGVARGTSPLIVSDLAPGDHTVALEGDGGSAKQTVTIEAGVTASLVANLANTQVAAASSGGWISVSTPKPVQLFEDGRLLGSSDTERLMVPAGNHQLEIVSDSLGYRNTRSVQVSAGKVTAIKVEFPKGVIALNASPWADVWIDGEKVGETPIGNLSVTLGTHEVIFRNPELGEQRHLVTVTLTGTARLSVDMKKKP